MRRPVSVNDDSVPSDPRGSNNESTMDWGDRLLGRAQRAAPILLIVFCTGLIALNWGQWHGWNREGFATYFTQPIMVTTLFDFAWVLAIFTAFIHQDARRHGLSYWWILPTYPFMPTIGLLLYVIVRNRKFASRGESSPPLGA